MNEDIGANVNLREPLTNHGRDLIKYGTIESKKADKTEKVICLLTVIAEELMKLNAGTKSPA